MTMMFEVADLAVASPATVSRCGMVYMGTNVVDIWPLVECWTLTLPPLLTEYTDQLKQLFEDFLLVSCMDLRPKSNKIGGDYFRTLRDCPTVYINCCGIFYIHKFKEASKL